MALEVSIVIPARDEEATIAGCLAALARQSVGAPALEVIVLASGGDDTAGAAARAGADAGFGRFEVVRLTRATKNVALRTGCRLATAPVVVLLDADTELVPDAVAELAAAVRSAPTCAVHGAALPRFDTWVSRYWELNRKLVKDLRFDGTLSGELIAIRRATLVACDPLALFPERVGAKDDLYLGLALATRGCRVGYVPTARATTLVPWTFGVLARTMLRSRRGAIRLASRGDAAAQAALSVAVVGGAPAALALARWSLVLAAVCAAPLVAYAAVVAARIGALRRRGLGDHRRELPTFLALDLLGRAIKLWALAERVVGRAAPRSYRGGRPGEVRVARVRRAA